MTAHSHPERRDFHAGTRRLRTALPLGLAFTLAAILAARASTTLHYWTGGSPSSGNWTSGANWLGGVAPSGGNQRLIFQSNAARKVNTNNFAAGTTFESIWISDDGYNIYGNSVRINFLRARCPTGTTTTFRPDIIAPGSLEIFNETNNSTFQVLGDISLGANDLNFPNYSNLGDITIGGVISGSGDVWKQNTGEVRFSGLGPNTYSGRTYVATGILRLNRYSIGTGLSLLGATAIPGDVFIGDYASTLIGDIVVLDRDNQIANTSTVTINPTGSLELSDENDTVGELVLAGGTVTTGSGSLGVDGDIRAVLPILVSKDSTIAGHLTLGARGAGPQTIDVSQGVQLNVPAQISGVTSATLIKANRGELILTASNVFSGDVEIHGGTVTVTHSHALGSTTGVTLAILGTLVINGTIGIAEPLVVPGPAGTLQLVNGSASWLGNITLEDDLSIIVPTNTTLSVVGQISGPAGWTKIGAGTLQFKTTYTNTYAGTSWVRDGKFIMDGVFNQPVIPGPFVIGNSTDPAQSTRVWPIKQNQIADTARVTVERSGLLEVGGYNETVGSLEGSGSISIGLSGSLVVGRDNSSTAFSGIISGSGGFQKIGGGTLTLAGTNTYAGPTSLCEGTLLVDGMITASSALNLNFPLAPSNAFPAILGGGGFVSAIVPSPGGVIAPGASPGRLSVQGAANLADTELRIELNGTLPGAGYDQLRAAAGVSLNNTRLVVTSGFEPTTNDTFTILEKTSAGSISGTFLNLPEGATLSAGPQQYQITYQGGSGNDVVLRRIDVPGLAVGGISAADSKQMIISGQSAPFVTFILEVTPHLNQPVPWTPIATNSANAAGFYEFTDPYADNGVILHPMRIYRLRRP